MSTTDTPMLAKLRREIDRIDEAMHRLLLDRGEIIGRLIKAKRTTESGSAFRPAREADMMRRLVERHSGILPLDTAEGIWRVIIATFTYVQAPFRVHVDFSAGESAMRDCERFHFGFTVPLAGHMGPSGVLAAIAAAPGDLGLIPVQGSPGGGVWWGALEPEGAPKIIARLPFVERQDHPAGLPVFAIARPHPDAIVNDVKMWSVRVAGWGRRPAQALASLADAVVVPDRGFDGAALLVPVLQGQALDEITGALVNAGASVRSRTLVGSHARRYTVTADARPMPAGM
ncbi:MAG TPA: chorismate mutase [Xanthobacteraceae bacterium]|nr:chorismate mutase [Xanthobacteraceae bacterium]